MLAQKTYPTEHIDRCRLAVDERIAAYHRAVADTGARQRTTFEQLYCRDLMVLLDAWFMHRTRAVEGKDGNPANEVRMLAASIIHHNGVLAADSTIRYRAEHSITELEIGAPINLTIDQTQHLAHAYLDTIIQRFGDSSIALLRPPDHPDGTTTPT
jgi:hypothetical protein